MIRHAARTVSDSLASAIVRRRKRYSTFPWVMATSVLLAAVLLTCGQAAEQHQDLPHYRLMEHLRVGGGEDTLSLTRVTGAALDGDGNLFLAQPLDHSVWVLSSEGALTRKIGRPGSGPGEFLSPALVGVRGDTLWVTDPGLSRLNFFTLQGQFLTSIAFTAVYPGTGYAPGGAGVPLGSGETLASPAFRMSTEGPRREPLLKLSPEGVVTDTLGWWESSIPIDARLDLGKGGWVIMLTQPFMDLSHVEVSKDGSRIWVVTRFLPGGPTATSRVVAIGTADGDTLVDTHVSVPGVRVTDEQVDRILRERYGLDTPPEGLTSARFEALLRRALVVPEYVSPVEYIVPDGQNGLWLPVADGRWIILDAQGSQVGTVEGPAGLRVRTIQDRDVVAVGAGPADVPFVVWLQVEEE